MSKNPAQELSEAVQEVFSYRSFKNDTYNTAYMSIDITILPQYYEYISSEYVRVADHMRAARTENYNNF